MTFESLDRRALRSGLAGGLATSTLLLTGGGVTFSCTHINQTVLSGSISNPLHLSKINHKLRRRTKLTDAGQIWILWHHRSMPARRRRQRSPTSISRHIDLCHAPHVQHLRRPMLRSCRSTAMELAANQSKTVSQSGLFKHTFLFSA